MEYKQKKKRSEDELIDIWQHTCKTALQNFPLDPDIDKTVSIFPNALESFSKLDDVEKSEISVVDGDCVQVAKDFVAQGEKVCMLNMASKWKPGGGVFKGKTAQEEHLCRLSNLYLFLSSEKYPLGDDCCLLSQNVTFFKDVDHSKLKKPWKCDIISIAAFQVAKASDFSEKKYEGTVEKIKLMLSAAKKTNCSVLVLSAFGCGAYQNPNDQVAKAFYQVLVAQGWGKKFSKIVFAIIDDKNSNENLKVFKDQFKDVSK